MANLMDQLGEPEQRRFMQLTGIHPRVAGVNTHREAISYLTLLDEHRRKKRAAPKGFPTVTLATRAPGLLGLTMGRFD